MKSMTGFGLGKAQSKTSNIEISIRSVNGRFLETRFHIPREFIPFESELKKTLEKYFSRGTVDIFVLRKLKPGVVTQEVSVNKVLLKKYAQAYKDIAKELKTTALLHVESLAKLPDVIKLEETHAAGADDKKGVLEAMKMACAAADKERLREGKALCSELSKILAELSLQISDIQSLREEANQTLHAKLEQKIRTRLAGVELDPSRLSQEIVIQLEKSDINEELARLKEHLENYEKLLWTKEVIGKKLDFYTQELLREVNTIGSKSNISKLTQIVVHAKTLIERLREQVQNIE